MSNAQQAMQHCETLMQAILHHPFNLDLASGDLDPSIFGFYMIQDHYFLTSFARCLAMISAKISPTYMKQFLSHAIDTIAVEQNEVHHHFFQTLGLKSNNQLSPATLHYTSYLEKTCFIEPVEIGVATVLPCFWIYQIVGQQIAATAQPNNPYARWIDLYAGEAFGEAVSSMKTIYNTLAQQASATLQQRMQQGFYQSAGLEWHFWQDAYTKKLFDAW